jgi:hypothetical protein
LLHSFITSLELISTLGSAMTLRALCGRMLRGRDLADEVEDFCIEIDLLGLSPREILQSIDDIKANM